MTANISKILIIGGTSGIGEAFARRFHAKDKKVIITGRRTDRLEALSASLPGTETLTWDVTDLSSIPKISQKVLKDHSDLDTIFLNAGVSRTANLTDPSSTDDGELINEITTNFTSVVLLTRALLPHLVERAASGNHAALIVTSSGLGFSPAPASPIYCATKAAIHSFLVSVRQQVAAHAELNVYRHLSICEIVPPFVDTELLGEDDKKKTPVQPMPLEDYMNDAMGKMDVGEVSGKLKPEIGTGSAEMRLNAWRGAIGPILEKFGFKE